MLLEEFDEKSDAVINPEMEVEQIVHFPAVTISCFSHSLFEKVCSDFDVKQIAEVHCAAWVNPIYEVKYKGKNISEVLDMTVDEGVEFFANVPRVLNKLKSLQDVGLGYIRLGQPATTLSGGEAQRVKLATELSKRSTGRTLYILDEPTTGLHSADIHKLMNVLQLLVNGGDTVVVIEHNLDVIKVADYLIDLGPEGGNGGGTIVATGTPEEVCKVAASYTGKFLAPVLERTKKLMKKKR